jgi:hypothetical protein
MTNSSLAQSYLIKATKRLKILPVLLEEAAYSDVVREAQEIVELALRGMLRQVGGGPGGGVHPAPPTNVATGGRQGDGDAFMLLSSTGVPGAGGKLGVTNFSQWARNYATSGITSITMHVNNFGSTDLSLRLMFEDPMGGPPANQAISALPITVAANSGWRHISFPILESNLLALNGTVGGALPNTTWLRIFSGSDPIFPGPDVAASLGVDNINAVPEPSSVILVVTGIAAFALWRRLS